MKILFSKNTLVSLSDILAHDSASVAFLDFLELEQASAIIEFLSAVTAYQNSHRYANI